ncbi:hypothetical protein CYMTET_52970 [Cymbomonas tetramitiformis]|uniref:Uncharacterized protein n=1 Tax=Cymbomonas tetramitiformis TaxID=36881 RepID=A0AAE0BHX0_9CHLO|nr:hypothetical protein CYMTET_52970 [Cymbomonas tetramitiformis]
MKMMIVTWAWIEHGGSVWARGGPWASTDWLRASGLSGMHFLASPALDVREAELNDGPGRAIQSLRRLAKGQGALGASRRCHELATLREDE